MIYLSSFVLVLWLHLGRYTIYGSDTGKDVSSNVPEMFAMPNWCKEAKHSSNFRIDIILTRGLGTHWHQCSAISSYSHEFLVNQSTLP